MASEKPDKKEKKDKKAKRSETDGVVKASKKEKKEKKGKEKKKLEKKLAEARDLDEKLQAAAAATVEKSAPADNDGSDVDEAETLVQKIAAELVPFAVPLADEKHGKKVLKSRSNPFDRLPFLQTLNSFSTRLPQTSKANTNSYRPPSSETAAKAKTLKRGVKEVVKTLRKSPSSGPKNQDFPGVVVIAGDISPMDVISHIPVLCEDHNVPYIFVTSRAELGAAGATKRPTSVVMVCEKRVGGGKKSGEKEVDTEAEEFADAYKDLVKLVQKETLKQARV
ncbi:50S ribosomal protein L30e-like protein [Zalerion maritima]|uniref:50S ribosomal protein L30e-like protein n=1 Tax=Zalerion maritima TaxID=339359 RepID=A0AAD5WTV8_9PEZI|nr:50S ribosomal protein L30e-like protein [Zalerion maritima]